MSEFTKDERYLAWERFCEAANHEKEWMNQRLNWLFTIQGFLFTGYIAILRLGNIKTNQDVLAHAVDIIAWAGLIHSILGLIGVLAAATMHWRWTSTINNIVYHAQDNEKLTFGSKPHWPARASSIIPPFITSFFILLWLYLIYESFVLCILNEPPQWLYIAIPVILAIVMIIWRRQCRKIDRDLPEYKWPSN